MKFWMIFAGLLLTPALQAQVPFYDYPSSLYYSGTYLPGTYYPGTYYSSAYYPGAYYPGPYYPFSPYTIDRSSLSNTNETIDALTRQVQRLTEEVQTLQSQIIATDAQRALARVAEEPPYSYERSSRPVTLILKNGRRIEAQGYAIAGQTIWVVSAAGIERIPVTQLNLAAIRRENVGRDVFIANGS